MPIVVLLRSDGNDKREPELPRHSPGQCTTILNLEKLDYKSQKKLLDDASPGYFTVAVIVDASEVQKVVESPVIQMFGDVTTAIARFVFVYRNT